MQYTKSPRFVELSQPKKKYISSRSKRTNSKKYSQPKSKENSTSQNRKGIDKRYFEYIKHNESLN